MSALAVSSPSNLYELLGVDDDANADARAAISWGHWGCHRELWDVLLCFRKVYVQ